MAANVIDFVSGPTKTRPSLRSKRGAIFGSRGLTTARISFRYAVVQTRCSEGEVVSNSAHLQAGKRNPRQYSRRSLLPAAWKLTSECRLEERCRALRRVVGRARKLRA
jgi:hypothetical protein